MLEQSVILRSFYMVYRSYNYIWNRLFNGICIKLWKK